jgi:hypothetical protein
LGEGELAGPWLFQISMGHQVRIYRRESLEDVAGKKCTGLKYQCWLDQAGDSQEGRKITM